MINRRVLYTTLAAGTVAAMVGLDPADGRESARDARETSSELFISQTRPTAKKQHGHVDIRATLRRWQDGRSAPVVRTASYHAPKQRPGVRRSSPRRMTRPRLLTTTQREPPRPCAWPRLSIPRRVLSREPRRIARLSRMGLRMGQAISAPSGPADKTRRIRPRAPRPAPRLRPTARRACPVGERRTTKCSVSGVVNNGDSCSTNAAAGGDSCSTQSDATNGANSTCSVSGGQGTLCSTGRNAGIGKVGNSSCSAMQAGVVNPANGTGFCSVQNLGAGGRPSGECSSDGATNSFCSANSTNANDFCSVTAAAGPPQNLRVLHGQSFRTTAARRAASNPASTRRSNAASRGGPPTLAPGPARTLNPPRLLYRQRQRTDATSRAGRSPRLALHEGRRTHAADQIIRLSQ